MKDILAKTFAIQFQKIQTPLLKLTIQFQFKFVFVLYTFGSIQHLSTMVYTELEQFT